jgi:HSP20 family protein
MWDLFDEIRRMQEEMDRMFGDFYGRQYRPMLGPGKAIVRRAEGDSYPREALCDIQETDKEVVVTAELPGMDKGDISVDVTSDAIEVKAEKKREEKEEHEGVRSYASYYSGFHRTLPLPSSVDADKAKATYHNGVLEITLPKSKASAGRSIKVE